MLSDSLISFQALISPKLVSMSSSRECQPLKTLDEIEDWSPETYKFEKPAKLQDHKFHHGIKVIVCHDMKGGYQEDR